MNRKLILSVFCIILSLFFYSCSNDNENYQSQKEELNDKQKLLQETSILLGKMLVDKEVKEVLDQKMKEVDEDREIVSFAYLFEEQSGLRKNEIIEFKNRKINSTNIFKKALKNEFEKNEFNYKTIANVLEQNVSKDFAARKSTTIADELASLLVSEELQIFFPFGSNHDKQDIELEEYYVSYDPLNGAQTNTGYKFKIGDQTQEIVYGMRNDFLDENPVYLVVPIDPCDIPGKPCDSKELFPAKVDANSSLYPSADIFDLTNIEGFTKKFPGDSKKNEVKTKLLTYNANHNNIPDSDIISSYIPRIQIEGTDYMGFAGTHQRLVFYRASPDGTVTQNSDGTITASPNSYMIKDFRCKRKYVKGANWLDFNVEFDPDWTKSENTQNLAVFSKHLISFGASYDLTVRSGFKIENGEIVPQSEVSGVGSIKVSVGSAEFRANSELSRRMVLATNVGYGTTGKTINDNGVNYNVKTIGIINYYMKHYHTSFKN